MKQILLLLALAISILKASAQTYEANFLGNDFLLYKGVSLKLKEDASSGFTYAFYGNLEHCQSPFDNNVIYPDPTYKFNTVKDSLANRTFVVEDIIVSNSTSSGSMVDKPIFVLKDSETNQKIYFLYDKKYEHSFPFKTSKIVFNKDALCSKVERQVDDFTGDVKMNTPMIKDYEISPMIIYKNKSKGKIAYYLSLQTYGSTVVVDGSGVIILFSDGTKWSKPVKIDVEADTKGFEYSAFITLTQSDLNTFSSKRIKKFRLYIFDEEINPSDADKFKVFATCIKDAN